MTSTSQWEDVDAAGVVEVFFDAASPDSHKRIAMALVKLPGSMSQVGKRAVERGRRGMRGTEGTAMSGALEERLFLPEMRMPCSSSATSSVLVCLPYLQLVSDIQFVGVCLVQTDGEIGRGACALVLRGEGMWDLCVQVVELGLQAKHLDVFRSEILKFAIISPNRVEVLSTYFAGDAQAQRLEEFFFGRHDAGWGQKTRRKTEQTTRVIWRAVV